MVRPLAPTLKIQTFMRAVLLALDMVVYIDTALQQSETTYFFYLLGIGVPETDL